MLWQVSLGLVLENVPRGLRFFLKTLPYLKTGFFGGKATLVGVLEVVIGSSVRSARYRI